MDILYSDKKEIDKNELANLIKSVGWNSYKYPESSQKAIMNSNTVFSAWDNNNLVGLISVIDDTMHAYVTYLMINPKYQNEGIGSVLLQKVCRKYYDFKIELRTLDAAPFYIKHGFKCNSIGMTMDNLQLRES